jgi:hypothetical protein
MTSFFRTDLNYLPAVEIAGANFDSFKDETTERWGEKRPSAHLPERDSRAKTTKGGNEVGGQVSSSEDVRVREAASADREVAPHVIFTSGEISSPEASDDDNQEAASHCMFTSSESSFSESDDDDKDFLDLLVDSLDCDFDPDLFV